MQGKRSRRNFFICAFLLGLGIFIYPSLSDYIIRRNVVRGANAYTRQIMQLSDEEIEQMWEDARTYNDSLSGNPVPDPFIPGSGRVLPENYLSVLDMGDGIMGYIDISKIRVYLPIRHGTSEEVLDEGAGHIEQTGLPIGEKGNLSVITAHTGLPSAEMFNRLTELVNGDIFMVHVLDETLTYEVDDIRIILPDEIESLLPVAGKDYITLITCTPYGVNTHRLLVRGTRIPNEQMQEGIAKELSFPWKLVVVSIVAILFFVLIFILKQRQRKKIKENVIAEQEKKRIELVLRMQETARKRAERKSSEEELHL